MSAGPGPAGYAGSTAQLSLGKGGVSFLVQEHVRGDLTGSVLQGGNSVHVPGGKRTQLVK